MKLQHRHSELEQKYSHALSTTGNVGPDHFVSKLLKLTADLYDKSLYRFDQLFVCFSLAYWWVAVKYDTLILMLIFIRRPQFFCYDL